MFFLALLFCFSTTLLAAEHFLTFVIPCYNCAPWIQQAVDSIYEQKNLQCSFEVICTDDGSTDGTFLQLTMLSQAHPNLHIFRHENNRGGAAARNTCIAHSQGDLIFCLDADNFLAPDSVQLLIEQMEKTGHDAVAFGGVQYFVQNGEKTGFVPYDTPNQRFTLKDLVQNPNSAPWSGNYLFTKSSFHRAGGYIHYGAADTYAFGFHQVLSGSTISYLPGTYYFHRHGIEGYYIREGTSRRLPVHFFELLLSHEELFTPQTIELIRRHRTLAKAGKNFWDQIQFLQSKAIELKAM